MYYHYHLYIYINRELPSQHRNMNTKAIQLERQSHTQPNLADPLLK